MRDSKCAGLGLALVLAAVAMVMFLTGCELLPVQPTPAAGPSAPAPTGPPSTPVGSVQPPVTPTVSSPPSPATITITVWTTEAFSPTQAITTGQIVATQVAAFEETHPEARLRFVLKKPYGKGGILDFLLSTKAVVPDLLPDLVLIDVDELDTAVQGNVIQPLGEVIPADVVADLYSFARDATTFDGQLYGLQLWADLDHLIYNTGKMTIPPRSWPGVLSNPGPYIFPAGGQSALVNDAFLIQYLAVLPQPSAAGSEAPFLDQSALTSVLQFYQEGVSQGVIPADVVDFQNTDDCWRAYLAGDAALAEINAHRYLAGQEDLRTTGVAAIPSMSGPAGSLGQGWAMALVATDPARQAAAVDFLVQIAFPEVNGSWAQAADYLPTRQSALAYWDEGELYNRFIQQQLQTARALPVIPNYAQVAAALQVAVKDVLTGAASPEQAAAEAIESAQ
jgi:multiple sugar transport system substrate-binding protein